MVVSDQAVARVRFPGGWADVRRVSAAVLNSAREIQTIAGMLSFADKARRGVVPSQELIDAAERAIAADDVRCYDIAILIADGVVGWSAGGIGQSLDDSAREAIAAVILRVSKG